MRKALKRLGFLCLILVVPALWATAPAESKNAALLTRPWDAQWISHPTASLVDYGVFHFRKTFELANKPQSFVVHVSADNRYRLFVNGTSVSVGPARSDPLHWQFESVDIARYLHEGKNTLAAVVWNQALEKPFAQMSMKTAFLLKGDTEAEKAVNTDATWKVYQDPAYSPIPLPNRELQTYIVIGASEQFTSARYPWGWEQAGYDDGAWPSARGVGTAYPHGTGTGSSWYLIPRSIPLPDETPQRLGSVRRSEGATPPERFLAGNGSWEIPAGKTVTVLLDQGFETTAYPELLYSGGAGAQVEIHYAEALIDDKRVKGNRNEIEGKQLHGFHDTVLPDGGTDRTYSPLWYRTFRYVELRIKTADTPLTLQDFRGRFTAYPFREEGRFASDDATLRPIWEVGWRTARLCAFETYMDCPYYEQFQYVGDTRIQALISLYVSGDDRLMKNAIALYDRSRLPEGLTQSRFPSADPQVINTFSLFWVSMIHDYWRHREDAPFVESTLPGMHGVLHWFEKRIDPSTGLLGPLPYWTFVDWADEWAWNPVSEVGGVPSGAAEGGSAIVTLQLVMTLRQAAELSEAYGQTAEATKYRNLAASLAKAVKEHCWDDGRKLIADSPAKNVFSQHANTLAVLSGTVTGPEARGLIERTISDKSLIQCTQYFAFYLLRAMKEVGLGDRYIAALQPWRHMLDQGLTTFAEKQDPTRSDCHAWSASPNYELLATVCGIEPSAPGFKRVRIAPNPGPLNRLDGVVPHPDGQIKLHFEREGVHGKADIELPAPLAGEFFWNGRSHPLKGGKQTIKW